MAQKIETSARLIAIDGSRGADVTRSADRLAKALRARGVTCVISRWDASGLFGELGQAAERDAASPRTLSLVYAADLAFRLRWEVRPALESGSVVIVAPYVETAIAFGNSCGLPEQWLRELLRFAPQADVQGLARERKLDRTWKPRLDRGFPEYCAALFEPSSPRLVSKQARAATIAALEKTRRRRVHRLSGKGIKDAARAITRGRPA
jgi:hypothetical protein